MGKLDLPGGKPEHGESPKQTLTREILEETGVHAHASRVFDNYSTLTKQFAEGDTHHLGMVYLILSYDETNLINTMDTEDSLGAQWYRLEDLTQDVLSPFAYAAIRAIEQTV